MLKKNIWPLCLCHRVIDCHCILPCIPCRSWWSQLKVQRLETPSDQHGSSVNFSADIQVAPASPSWPLFRAECLEPDAWKNLTKKTMCISFLSKHLNLKCNMFVKAYQLDLNLWSNGVQMISISTVFHLGFLNNLRLCSFAPSSLAHLQEIVCCGTCCDCTHSKATDYTS